MLSDAQMMEDDKMAKLCSILEKKCNTIEKENLMLAHRILQARKLVRRCKEDIELLKTELEAHDVDWAAGHVEFLLHSDDEELHPTDGHR